MWPDQVSNPGPLTYESRALPIALLGPACADGMVNSVDPAQIAPVPSDLGIH